MGRYVYRAVSVVDGKPTGFIGRYRSIDEARVGAKGSKVPVRITRQHITDHDYQVWADSGYQPRGWLRFK